MQPIITISIVLYKTPIEQLNQCIRSIFKFQGSVYLYLVDNSPTDAIKNIINPPISYEYIHLPHNPGFGAAHNVAIRLAYKMGSHYHLVLNADVRFDTDVITPMLSYLDKNPKVGQLMPKILNTDGSIQHLCKLIPTPIDLLFHRFLPKKLAEISNRRFELHHTGYDKIMFVPYLSGCFMLLRQSSIQNIGLFDERYFMYPEDIDLTRRIAQLYETLYFPDVSIIHEHGAASRKSIHMLLIHALNIIKYFNKWGWFFDSARRDLNKKTLNQFL